MKKWFKKIGQKFTWSNEDLEKPLKEEKRLRNNKKVSAKN